MRDRHIPEQVVGIMGLLTGVLIGVIYFVILHIFFL